MTEPAAYSYRAARRDGTVELGAVDATSREAAAAVLAQRGLWVLEVRSTVGTMSRRRLPSRDLAVGLRLLASLLDAGLPVGRALTAFAEIAPARWQAALPAVRQSVREGQSLGAALAAAPLD